VPRVVSDNTIFHRHIRFSGKTTLAAAISWLALFQIRCCVSCGCAVSALACGVCCSDRVTLSVLELIENGRLQTLKTKWWFQKGECTGKDGPPKKVGEKQNIFLLYAVVPLDSAVFMTVRPSAVFFLRTLP